jgi:hypothetical protein
MQGTENDRFVSSESHNLLLAVQHPFPCVLPQSGTIIRSPQIPHAILTTKFLSLLYPIA